MTQQSFESKILLYLIYWAPFIVTVNVPVSVTFCESAIYNQDGAGH